MSSGHGYVTNMLQKACFMPFSPYVCKVFHIVRTHIESGNGLRDRGLLQTTIPAMPSKINLRRDLMMR